MSVERWNFSVCSLALLAIVVLADCGVASTPSAADEVVTLNYARAGGGAPVSQSYILLHDGDTALTIANPRATLLIFVGGRGRLRVSDEELNIDAVNFLLRSRHPFASSGPFNVAVMDAASDFLALPNGLRGQRTSVEYLEDMRRVIADLRVRFPGLPVWAVGTSRGSTAAAQAAAELSPAQGPDGIVLTSSVTVDVAGANSLNDVALEKIAVPTLVTAHRQDACSVTPPGEIKAKIIARLTGTKPKAKIFVGGLSAISEACGALSPHGYFGIETTAVRFISRWIRKRSP